MLVETPSLLITRTLLAGDGEEALHIVRREVVHVVLLDMHMPKLTGLETLRLVRKLNAALPCILLSGALDEVLIEQAHRADAFSVLPKPVALRQLTSAVGLALRTFYDWPEG